MAKTSVSLPDDVAAELARLGPDARRRSAIVEKALRAYFVSRRRRRNDTRLINANATELNAEAQDVLGFQKLP